MPFRILKSCRCDMILTQCKDATWLENTRIIYRIICHILVMYNIIYVYLILRRHVDFLSQEIKIKILWDLAKNCTRQWDSFSNCHCVEASQARHQDAIPPGWNKSRWMAVDGRPSERLQNHWIWTWLLDFSGTFLDQKSMNCSLFSSSSHFFLASRL